MIDEITGMKTYFFKDTLTGHTFKVLATEDEIQKLFRSNPDLEPSDISGYLSEESTSLYLDTFE